MSKPRPPFPLTTTDDTRRIPPRPWIVKAYLTTSVVAVVYGIALDVKRGSFSVFGELWAIGLSALFVFFIWRASRAGWVINTALSLLFLPFVLRFLERGAWGVGVVALQVLLLVLLLSPWMFRWIWRSNRLVDGES